MTWDLARCIKEVLPNQNHPVRRNVEFFIGFRNKIEHRYEQLLEPVVAGKAQSLIMNYEQMLIDAFGEKESLADRLRFPVFLTALTDGAVAALKEVHKRLPKRLTKYVSDYDESLTGDVRDDHRYEFRVYLVQQTGPKTDADASMRFVRYDDLTDEERAKLEQVHQGHHRSLIDDLAVEPRPTRSGDGRVGLLEGERALDLSVDRRIAEL
jgi:hypothetical protein